MQGPDCSYCNRQHNGGLLHKQTGWYEVRLSLCPPMEASVLVPSQVNNPEGKTHSRSLECDSGQAFQTQSSDSNRVVPISAAVQSFVFQMGPTTSRLVCNPVQSQIASFYYATIAYHVGLNAVLGWPQGIMANVIVGRSLSLLSRDIF